MTGGALLAAAAGMLLTGGAVLLVMGLRRSPAGPARPPGRIAARWGRAPRRTRLLLAAGLAGGFAGFLLTGWVVAIPVGPLAALGLPVLLAPASTAGIDKLDALAEWTRSLSGVLGAGAGLEQALIATQRSAPAAIKDPVDRLVARLRARWPAAEALRGFADDIADPTGDLVATALILASKRRGPGLGAVLDGLAASVADEVRIRRQIEADRAKPRGPARWITLISLAVLALLALNGTYMAPYGSALGQVVLAVLLGAYAAALLWLRRVAVGRPAPRFLTDGGGRP